VRLISVNVGQPRVAEWNGEVLETGIFKKPVAGRTQVHTTNVEGDRQADLTVHGGVDKAVYAYSSEHYPFWRDTLERADLGWGMFGENLTTEGLDEASVRIGDVFRVGTVELEVSQPRLPCKKLNMKFGRADMGKHFLKCGRLGFYFRVRQEGVLESGDTIRRIFAADTDAPTITELARLETTAKHDRALLERAARCTALSDSWREGYTEQLAKLDRPTNDGHTSGDGSRSTRQ
jgi:MOSC domain-containing protein YiiM